MIFDKFPFTNYEKINLDWLLKKMQECVDAVSNFIVDAVLDITSNHAIANKAVCEALNTKLTVNNDRVSYTNLDSDLQGAYNKANTALQAVPDTYRTATAQDAIDNTKQDKLFPNGLNIEDVNRFVCIGGIDGDGSYYTKDIGNLYTNIKRYYFDMGGKNYALVDHIKAKKFRIYVYSNLGSSAVFKFDYYAKVKNSDIEYRLRKAYNGLITSSEAVMTYGINLISNMLFCAAHEPSPIPSISALNTWSFKMQHDCDYIYKIELYTDGGSFAEKSFIQVEVEE